MKRILALLLCLMMVFSMAACSTPAPEKTNEPTGTEDPSNTTPAQTEPVETEPTLTEPAPTEPAPTEPTPTEPAPTEPKPTEPKPTEPKPTEPKPTEPAPTDPPHKHNYQREVVYASCDKEGYIRDICTCGEIYGNVIVLEKTAHYWIEATCASPKYCYYCNTKEGDPLPHTWLDATYNQPKTCSKCKATEGSPLAKPTVTVKDSFPKSYSYYTRSFTVTSCDAYFDADAYGYRYIKISMTVERHKDTAPKPGKLALKISVYDANGAMIKQDSIWTGAMEQNSTAIMTAAVSLPKNIDSDSYSISFVESY